MSTKLEKPEFLKLKHIPTGEHDQPLTPTQNVENKVIQLKGKISSLASFKNQEVDPSRTIALTLQRKSN